MNNISKENITNNFKEAKNVRQFAELLNQIDEIFNPKESNKAILTEKNINFLFISKEKRYKEYVIPKKNGKNRVISAPGNFLKRVQTLINYLFRIVFADYYNFNSNGFIDGRNILRNARPHTNKKFVLNIDLADFFPSINFRRIKSVLELHPFNLNHDRENLAFLISNLVTYKNALPQGAPTSPIISNIVCQRLDRKLTKFSIANKIKYTRYADDLTFSSNKNIFNEIFLMNLKGIINEEFFKINSEKTRVRTSMQRQEVTGIIVNQKPNVKREYLRCTKAILNNWEKGGFDYAQTIFNQHKKQKDKNIDFSYSLKGQIDFIGSIVGKENPTYIKLKLKFEYLFFRLDFRNVTNDNVRQKLIIDNKKMEMILFDKIHASEDKFIPFCTSAFHQIENLLNYYYNRRFPKIKDFKDFIWANNPAFVKRYKSFKTLSSDERNEKLNEYKLISDFNINLLVYLYEKEFYFDAKKSYNKEITYLREIRNDESHRCSINGLKKEEIMINYGNLQLKWNTYFEKNRKSSEKNEAEKKLELQVQLFEFKENKNYKRVRKILSNVLLNITKNNLSYLRHQNPIE